MKLFSLFTTICICILIISCDKDSIQGDGILVSQKFELEPFSEISTESTIDIFIRKGDAFEATMQGDSNIVAQTSFNVSGDRLNIDPGSFMSSGARLKIDIVVPRLSRISNNGTGNIKGTTDFFDLEVINDGTGDVELTGQSVDDMTITNDGTGSILMFGLGSKNLIVENSGTGDAFVFVSDNLDVKISGTGNVYYRGRPEIIMDVSGIGQLIDDN